MTLPPDFRQLRVLVIEDEFLISVHVCHPSLCNDNLSGMAVATALARILASTSHRYTYRFLFVPGTIGPIAWLHQNQSAAQRIRHGLVLACVGDRGSINYKRSRRLTADIDRAVMHVLRTKGAPFEVRDFSPYGYDERQYCAPGFNLTPAVMDGCSDLLVAVFGDAGRHTRSAVGMAELPFDIPVEIEAEVEIAG